MLAARSGLDIAFWLLERGAGDRSAFGLPKLRWLLYLAQAHYAGQFNGDKLMPATFTAAPDGPIEPTLTLVLQSGLQNPWPPALASDVVQFLDGFWKQFGALPQVALQRIISTDAVWRETLERGAGSEILHADLVLAYRKSAKPPEAPVARPALKVVPQAATAALKPRTKKAKAADPDEWDKPLPPLGGDPKEVRFTADGRAVTRWRPKRSL